MKVIIAGGRNMTDMAELEKAIVDSGFQITEVVCGKARGADTLGEQWAIKNNIPVSYYPAEWDKYGKSAGYRRNEQMGQASDAAIIYWDGQSKGSGHMVSIEIGLGKPCHQHIV